MLVSVFTSLNIEFRLFFIKLKYFVVEIFFYVFPFYFVYFIYFVSGMIIFIDFFEVNFDMILWLLYLALRQDSALEISLLLIILLSILLNLLKLSVLIYFLLNFLMLKSNYSSFISYFFYFYSNSLAVMLGDDLNFFSLLLDYLTGLGCCRFLFSYLYN